MSHLKGLLGPVVIPVLGLLALADMGCGSTIAERHPHLDRRAVCVRPQEIEPDSSEFLISQDNVPVSNLHPEVVDRLAPTARTVYEVDIDADPSSPKYLPAPYNELTCPERFDPLPSLDEVTPRIPEASLELVVHEQRPEAVSKALAEELAKCGSHITGQVTPGQYVMNVNAYVANDGKTVAAFATNSTFKDRKLIACVAKVLRSTKWSALATSAPNVAAAPVALKGLLAQAQPAQPVPDTGPESGIRRIQPQPGTPPGNAPTGTRIPRIFVIPLGPIVLAAVVFGVIYFWSDNDAPAWALEMNPITRQPYASRWEYDEIQQMTPEQIREAQIKAAQSQPPPPPAPAPLPAPAPPLAPALTPQELREQQKKAEKCAKIAKRIDHILNAERKEPPKNGFPQGRKGAAERWREIAVNEGKWQPRPDGSLSKNMQGHLKAYKDEQDDLITELDNWRDAKCDDNLHSLPPNARQYAAQTPEYGPGKPLEPAPTPEYRPAPVPTLIAPQPKKASK